MKASYFNLLILSGLTAFVLRLLVAYFFKEFTVYNDLVTFQAWGLSLAKNGFETFYTNNWSDYLPGYLYVLWLLGEIQSFLTLNAFSINDEVFYKIPSMITDIGNALFIYLITKVFTSPKKAFITSAIFLFNPAIFANSTLWGQADSFMTFFLLSSFYYLIKGKFWISAILLGLAQTIKPIAIFSLPIYFLYMIFKNVSKINILVFTTLFLAIIFLSFIPFTNHYNIVQFILDRHIITANQYPYTSVNAFNFWSIFTKFWESDQLNFLNLSLQYWGWIIFISFYSFLLIALINGFKKIDTLIPLFTLTLTICYLAMFIFLTRMHERHLFFALTFVTLLLPILPITGILVIVALNILYIVNLYYAYSYLTNTPLILTQHTTILLSLIPILAVSFLVIIFLQRYVKQK